MGDKIWLGEQERKYSCGAASLKYALCILGRSPREEQLRKLARTSFRGTQTNSIVKAAARFGVRSTVRQFFEDAWEPAHAWLKGELEAGKPVILDVDGFQHYVVAVQTFGDRFVVIDPEGGPMDGSSFARVLTMHPRRLKPWWLSSEDPGEPEAFRGISLDDPTSAGPHLRFTEETVKRYQAGRPWILDEYLIDCVEIARAAQSHTGTVGSLSTMIRDIGSWLVARMSHWHGARAGDVAMLKAHVEDMALAADAMSLEAPSGATASIAADMATLLMAMLLQE